MQLTKMLLTGREGNMMNTGAIIQDLIDWIDNHLDSRLDIDTVARRAAIRSGTCSGSSKNIPGSPRRIYSGEKLQSRSNAQPTATSRS